MIYCSFCFFLLQKKQILLCFIHITFLRKVGAQESIFQENKDLRSEKNRQKFSVSMLKKQIIQKIRIVKPLQSIHHSVRPAHIYYLKNRYRLSLTERCFLAGHSTCLMEHLALKPVKVMTCKVQDGWYLNMPILQPLPLEEIVALRAQWDRRGTNTSLLL